MASLSKVIALTGLILVVSALSIAGGVAADKYAVSFNTSSARMIENPNNCALFGIEGSSSCLGGGAVSDPNAYAPQTITNHIEEWYRYDKAREISAKEQAEKNSSSLPVPTVPPVINISTVSQYVPPGYFVDADGKLHTFVSTAPVAQWSQAANSFVSITDPSKPFFSDESVTVSFANPISLPAGYFADAKGVVYKTGTRPEIVGTYDSRTNTYKINDPSAKSLPPPIVITQSKVVVTNLNSGTVVVDQTNRALSSSDPGLATVIGTVDTQTNELLRQVRDKAGQETFERIPIKNLVPVQIPASALLPAPAGWVLPKVSVADNGTCQPVPNSFCGYGMSMVAGMSTDPTAVFVVNFPDIPGQIAIINDDKTAYTYSPSLTIPDGYHLKDGTYIVQDSTNKIVGKYSDCTQGGMCQKLGKLDPHGTWKDYSVIVGGMEVNISRGVAKIGGALIPGWFGSAVRFATDTVTNKKSPSEPPKPRGGSFINTVNAAGVNTRIISGAVYVKTGESTGDGIGGVMLDTCTGIRALTDAYGRFAFPVRDGGSYCVRLAADPERYASLTGTAKTYEWQRAGINCQKEKTRCNSYEIKNDATTDTDYAFVFEYKNAPVVPQPPAPRVFAPQDRIKVISPSGASFVVGEPITIQWDAPASLQATSSVVDLYLTTGQGVDQLIASNIASSQRSYSWTLPASSPLIGSNMRIKVVLRNKQTGAIIAQALSDQPFSIRDVAVSANIRVVSPNGGERFAPGSTIDVLWSASGFDFVRITLMCENWSINTIYDIPANNGSYTITLPASAPTQALCRVQVGHNVRTLASSLPGRQDVSDGTFAISRDTSTRMIPTVHAPVVALAPGTTRVQGRLFSGIDNAPLGDITLLVGSVMVSTDAGGHFVVPLPKNAKFDIKIVGRGSKVSGTFYRKTDDGGFDLASDLAYHGQTVQSSCSTNSTKLCNTNYDFMWLPR